MAFVTGLLLIDAPASALNNSDEKIPGARDENSNAVKYIRSQGSTYPYVSAQAYRAWLRQTLEGIEGWTSSPVTRIEGKGQQVVTAGDPIIYWDDDLLGYMRAMSEKGSDEKTVTRISPLRVSTLVSIAPVNITRDFGVMARHEGNPVIFEHQFYRATLQGLFSLDLHASGTFTYRSKTGFRNLDDTRKSLAEERGLQHLTEEKAYRLSLDDRVQRVKALFEGMGVLHGGAKLAIHYTDVSPVLTMLAVTRGGNHIFGHVMKDNGRGLPQLSADALAETLEVHRDDILSPIYVGWVRGYMDDERARLEQALTGDGNLARFAGQLRIMHPRQAFRELIDSFDEHPEWLQ